MTPSGTLRLVLLAISAASLLLVRAPAAHAAEPSAKDLAAEALGAWDVLARNVELGTVRKKKVNGQQVLAGTATVFGHRVTLEGALAGASLRELSLAFSDKKQLTTDALAQLAGQDVEALLPTGLGGHLNVERLRVELQGKRVVGIEVAFQAGVAWRPFGEGALDVSGLRVSVGVVDPTGRRELVINLSGHTTLPDRLGRYLGLPGIQLAMMGAIETRPRRLWLRVDLSSAGTIPLGDQTVVGLEGAHLELVVNERGPTLTLGGTVGLRPASGGPLKLKGTVAINLTGEVYAQAWADGIWSNPLGASDKVHVIEPGLGFGVDFSAVPWPMPIVGLSGGVAIGADPARPDFGGSVVIGLHGGDPTQNMIDATLDRLNAADLIRPFAGHVPSDVTDTLQGIAITEGRLTIVPPGPGVRLFGAWYEPGFLIRGKMTALGTSGELLVDVAPLGVEAHAALSPIALPGLTITGADAGTGPSFYLFAKQNTVAMALSGALEVMGIRRAADIYFSDAGFSATVSGRIADRFDATLDVAGRSPLAGGAGLWVSGTMSGDFVGALVGHVTEQVNAKTRAARSAMASARADLERDKSRLVAIERQVGEARARVRAEKQAECDRFRVGDADRRKKQADKDRLDGRVATLEREIAELDRLIAGAKAHATRKKKTINPLDCRSGQVWDPIHGGGCYECPSGYSRDVTVHIERLGACSKSTASWEASRGVKVADLGATRADRDVVQRALAAMARGATDAGQAACRAANDVAMLDQVPAVKRLLEDKLSVARAVEAAQALLQGGEVVVGAFGATAAWLAARGGEAAGIIKVNEARFEGCLDQTANGTLAMRIRGTFADRPFDGAFDLRLSAPEGGFSQLADHLFAHGKLPPSKGNGRCTRPTVPRPKLGDLQANRRLADRMRGKKTTGAAAPPKRPAWAGPATRPGASPSRPGTAASPAGTATRPAGTAASRPGTAASPTGTAASPAGTAASRPGTAASTPSTPPPAVNPTRQCVQLTQGRIVWDHGANNQWDPRSLQELCNGTRDGRQPPACFTEIMSGRVSWGGGSRWQWKNAVALCGGTSDARETVSCFSRELAGGATWQAALAACRAR